MSLAEWWRRRKGVASITALAVLVATPITIAVVHQGFPVSDVDLLARDVWVTNGAKALSGRLNMQIEELDGAVSVPSQKFDVFQDGEDVFVFDDAAESLQRVDPAYTTLNQRIEVPAGSTVSYGGGVIAIVAPSGELWLVDAHGELRFDKDAMDPALKLGAGGVAVAGHDGVVHAISVKSHKVYALSLSGTVGDSRSVPGLDDVAVTTVGSRLVILEKRDNTLLFDDGSTVKLPETALQLQQPGPDRTSVVVATATGLLRVGFDKSIDTIDADAAPAAAEADEVAEPVVLGTCTHGAWASGARYLRACDTKPATLVDIPGATAASRLEFRVNRNVIALNDVGNGNAWLLGDVLTTVANWEAVTPPKDDESEEGDDKSSQQSFEDTPADRTEQNRAPIARDDEFGVRPGRTTILQVLDNDTDLDGDVLTITKTSEIADTAGALQLIDGGRALQLVPAAGATGTISFRYTVSDGRPGGVAEAQVNVTVRSADDNLPPVSHRTSGVAIERGQTVTYNVLNDWRDPDGDPLTLVGATSATGDLVRFTPDGFITFTHTSAELGDKSVAITISDGRVMATGEFIVQVKDAGSLNPVGTPDFASTFAGRSLEIEPLTNDLSPSGAVLGLGEVKALTPGIAVTTDLDRGVVSVRADAVGTYYLSYTITAGTKAGQGLIRVDVVEDPEQPLPPIAVKDTAYVRPNEPTTLSALANDASPSGRVIGIQSVDVPPTASQLSVEVLSNTQLRITAPSAMTEPIDFSYTITDGIASSTATVTVVPVPELTKHQAPIAVDDTIKVRTGDIATVPVLRNDFHPDGAHINLDPELLQSDVGADGLAFVTGDTVRIQAPSEPNQYTLTYRIFDRFGESAVAHVVVVVLGPDAKNNQPPVPTPVTARVFQGAQIPVEIPLSGIDPDGDSVVLTSAGGGATLGTVVSLGSTSFVYEAFGDSVGTDVVSYEVQDALGATAVGEVRIGVLPRGASMPPSAVQDQVSIRPGRTSQVPVLANDSDPNGYPISLDAKLLEIQDGITAKVKNDSIVIEAGETPGTYSLRYTISNGHGGTDDAFVIVVVSPDAAVQPPTAVDQVIEPSEVVGKRTIEVDVRSGAQNPGGLVSDLTVVVEGPNASAAEVNPDGKVTVTLGDTRRAIAFRLTNELDELSAMAFIVVPRYSDALPPKLKPEYQKPQTVDMNGEVQWKLADILDVPSGRAAIIIRPETATAGRSDGDPVVVDDTTLRYAPAKDYRGESSITFTVTDGTSAEDPIGNVATLTMRLVVGDTSFRDVAPTFSDAKVSIEAGEAATAFDLRAASAHPNPEVRDAISYSGPTGATKDVQATISGSTLNISSPFGVKPGTTVTLEVTLKVESFTVTGHVVVTVVPSTRPLAQAVDDVEPDGRSNTAYTLSPLENDFNPFAGEGTPLTIVSAATEGDALGATVTSTGSTVTVRTGPAKSGTVSVIYTLRDATDTPEREVKGRITVVVASAPEPVQNLVVSSPGSQQIAVNFQPPSSSNGAEVDRYDVTITGAGGTSTRTDCAAGVSCVFAGRTNGQVQTATVTAHNRVGDSSPVAATTIPYGVPGNPTNVRFVSSDGGTAPNGTVTMQWTPADSGSNSARYEWKLSNNDTGTVTDVGSAARGSLGAGTYTFQVRACNQKDNWTNCSAWVPSTNSATVTSPRPRVWVTRDGNRVTYHWSDITAGSWSEVTQFRCWSVAEGTQSGGHGGAEGGNGAWTVGGSITAGSGSIDVPCGTAVNDNYSVEAWKNGPWLSINESFNG